MTVRCLQMGKSCSQPPWPGCGNRHGSADAEADYDLEDMYELVAIVKERNGT